MLQLETSRIELFDPKRVSFGRHETFPLRFGWLTKGFQALKEHPDVFERDDATVALGVGKNMVHAIRYWMIASGVVTANGHNLEPTAIGTVIFAEDGWDPYLEDDATIWLIHWLLASNPNDTTAIWWFFNSFHKPEFTPVEFNSALKDFVRERIQVKSSTATLKHDVAVILRMYVPSTGNKRVPVEEALDSPLSMLDLVVRLETGKRYQSKQEARRAIPLGVLGYAIAELFEKSGQSNLPVETIFRGDGWLPGPGSIFRLTQDCLTTKLEELTSWLPGHYELRETAGIHQLYQLKSLKPLSFLEKHYTGRLRKRAA